MPSKASQTIAFLPDDEQSWNSFIKHMQFGEYQSLNLTTLISPLNKQDVQRMGSAFVQNINIIELPFTDTELISTLSPAQLSLSKRTLEGLESRKWRTRRLLNKHVLVVDDDAISVEISQQILDLGINVAVASSGEQALALCEMSKFDATLDCYLPGISAMKLQNNLPRKQTGIRQLLRLVPMSLRRLLKARLPPVCVSTWLSPLPRMKSFIPSIFTYIQVTLK